METTFTVSPSSTTIVKSGGTQNITVTSSDYDWSVNTDANWIQVSPNSGTTGETTVVLTTEENPYFQRSGSVEFVNTNGESSSVTVTQTGNSVLEYQIPFNRVGVTGNSYINLNYTFSGNETIKIEGASISKYANSGSTLFSITDSNSQTKVYLCYNGTKLNGNVTSGLFSLASPYDYFLANSTIEITPTEIKVNGVTNVPNRVNSLSGNCTITLFARTPQGSFSASGGWDLITVGAVTIYDSSNNVKARFVPVMLNESINSLRYYEEITKTLYTFSGSPKPIDTYFNQYNKINVGGNQIEDLYIGQTEVQTAYIGSSLAKLPKREINYITSGVGLTTPVQNVTKYFFDTGIRPKTTTKFRIEGTWRGKYNSACMVGSRCVNDNTDYRFFVAETKNAYLDFNSARVSMSNQTATSGNSFSYECGNNYLKNVNTSVKNTGTTQTSVSEDRTIKIYIDAIYFKRLRIWEGSTLVFDAQPITNPYKNSSTTVIYDSVSNRVLFRCYYNKE